ncbi:kinase-like protein, partial [Macrolepiota fuliginosa MF-IS2]
KALQGLQGDDAQVMIDYIHSVLLRPDLAAWLRKHSRIVLYRLCSTSMLYPQCYVLKDIVKEDSPEASGGFGDIYKGRHGNKNLCLKVVRLPRKSEIVPTLKEGMVWGELCHPNILPFYGIYYLDERREQFCLVSPWMDNGNLVAYLKDNPSKPRMPFIHDIASGLEYLHHEQVVHGDMKGANVLVSDSGRACITDFGLSSIPVDNTLVYSRGATTAAGFSSRWAAPEVLLAGGVCVTRKSDIWAFGCVCYEILVGRAPFHKCVTDTQIILKVLAGASPVGSVQPAQIDDEMWELIERCCARDPKDRPEFQEILEELKGSSVKDVDDVHAEVAPEKLHFRNAIGKREGVPIDPRRVEEIFNRVCTHHKFPGGFPELITPLHTDPTDSRSRVLASPHTPLALFIYLLLDDRGPTYKRGYGVDGSLCELLISLDRLTYPQLVHYHMEWSGCIN